MNLRFQIIVCSIFILLSSTKTCFAQYKVKVSYIQNQKTTNEFILFNDTVKLTGFKDSKIEELHKKGFESAYSFFEQSANDTLKLWIIEGNNYTFKISNIIYSDTISLRMGKKMEQAYKNSLTYSELIRQINNSLSFYENSGYPFASISIDSVWFSNPISADLFIAQHTKYNFDSIIIKGDAKIAESFIRQFYNFKKNQAYSEKKLKQAIKLSKQISFLSMTQNPEVLFNETECRTYLFINKRKSNSFDGIVGFIPSNNVSKGIQLTGDLKLKLNNLFAHGEQLNFDWRAYEANSQDLNIKSINPFLFSTPFGTEFLFKLNKKDSSFINLNYQIGISYFLSGFDNVKGFYEFSSSNTFSTSSPESSKFRTSKSNSYGIELNINRLNDATLATQGFSIKTSFAAGTVQHSASQTLSEDKSTRYNIQIQLPLFIPLYKQFIFATSIQSIYLNSKTLYNNEMLRFGGLKTLRGFNDDELLASFYSIINAEIRFMLEKYSYFSMFWNGAYYEKQGIDQTIHDTPWGLGLGIAFNTPAGIFSLNYAIGKQFNNPLDLRNSKIHFGITGSF